MSLEFLKNDQHTPVDGEKKRKAAIYLLPNLITSASLFCGLLSIKYAIDGRLFGKDDFFVYACYAILGAAVFDALDGSVARLTGTQSAFGVQLDSLCDLVSFGVAPAILAYNVSLYQYSRLGFCVCFIYVVCGALRLARFNVQTSLGRANGSFTGIPIPMAASPLAAFVLAQHEVGAWIGSDLPAWTQVALALLMKPSVSSAALLVIVFLLALGMVSTLEYHSHKSVRLPRKRTFRVFALVVILCALLFSLQFAVALSFLLLVYCLHGPVLWLFSNKDKADDDDDIFEPES